ncbi:puratrophin-1 isoform X2 [Perognathus longimembris pacificus]|uniref:puratrophin-1 isoform X2 n=1 Tax=Perognathus longimembris pacificus TaxID=214514 RepID=UPI002018CA84|nr:puratrophin-1 isoform X2 [Perognathus longimembris pacificus]
MEGPSEDGNVSLDSQGHATDWRFAVCSFRDAWEEKDPASQIQVKDPNPSRPLAGAAQSNKPQGRPIAMELQSFPEPRAVDGSRDGQRTALGGSSVQPQDPDLPGVESLLSSLSSHLNLTQDESDNPRESVVRGVGPGGTLPAGFVAGGLLSNSVVLGDSLPETSSKLLKTDLSGSSTPKLADCLLAQDLTWELLASGMAALPGTRDVEGRAVLLLYAHSSAWLHPKCSSHELICLLLYLRGIPRPEIQALGLTVVVDAQISSPSSSLFRGLSQLQEAAPGSVHRVLLVGKMPETLPSGLQLEQLPSHQSLLTYIPTTELPTSLGGHLPYCHQTWLDFRLRLEALLQSCQVVCALLQEAIENMKAVPRPMAPGEVDQLLQQAQILMRQVLDSPQLAWLQCQGGLELAWLKQVSEVTLSPDCRPAVDKADELYGQVDGLLHQLTLQSNQRIQAFELLQTLEAQEGGLRQTEVWLQEVGWPALEEPREPSLDMLLQAQGPFRELDQVAQEQVRRGEEFLQPLAGWEAAELGPPGIRFLALRAQLTEFSRALAQRRQRLADAEKLFEFFKQASSWAEAGQRVLAELEQESPGVVLQQLQLHWTRNPDLPPAHFRKMWALAIGLGSEGIRQECRWAWTRCQDTWLALDQKLEAALKSLPTGSTASLCVSQVPTVPATPPLRKSYSFDQNLGQSLRDAVHHCHRAATVTACHRPESGGGAQPRPSSTVPPPRSSTTVTSCHGPESGGGAQPRPSSVVPSAGSSDLRSPNRLQLVLAEMVATEREYVRALDYTMENYFPELDRPDVPQGLRGQRAHLFGNLEKLRDFHCHFFLRELEACTRHPPRVAYAFLRHRVQFGMYALYSKNKPRSDALMSSYGHAFFKDKQQALGDHLDLASYLLKPIQRMSKYALLLQELARACGGPVQELSALQAAQSLVHFQLRHGNDLLAMDAIQGCDVNLKEQGQLVRQDEFVVRSGRHKSLRRVFLFEELLLFSKPRHGPMGVDVFTYKRSFKMADLGLTECCGDHKLRFEIWFRRRKAKDTFVLQASSLATKQAWTADISRLLWRQAVHNKEVRMAEMVSMGVGNKAFRDIAPSEEAINDRNINYVLKGRARSRASIAVAPLDYDSSCLGASSTLPGDRASCSVLGSLNLHLYRDPALPGIRWPLYPPNFPEEATLETEAEMGSQPSLTPEDSEVSSQCPSASGSSGSDSSCMSGQALGRGLEDLSCV